MTDNTKPQAPQGLSSSEPTSTKLTGTERFIVTRNRYGWRVTDSVTGHTRSARIKDRARAQRQADTLNATMTRANVHTTEDIRRALVGLPVTLNGHDATISAGVACLVVRTLDGTMSGAWSYASAWRVVLHDGAFTL